MAAIFARILPTGFTTTARGIEDHVVDLSTVAAVLNDTDGSESLRLVLSGFPAGATFSAGHAGSGADAGKWVIDDPAQIAASPRRRCA